MTPAAKDSILEETLMARAVVIATPDARTRARCVVQFATRGDPIVSAPDFRAPHITDRVRGTATIAIAEVLLPNDTTDWRDIIVDHGWRGRIIVLGSSDGAGDPALDGIAYLPYPFDIARLVAEL